MDHSPKHIFYSTIVLIFLLNACSRKTTEIVSPVPHMESFSSQGQVDVPQNWWEVFDSDQLNNFVDSALASNFDLHTAWYRFREAEAVKRGQSSSFFPFLDGSAEAETFFPESPNGNSEQFQIGLQAEYELDLWGKIRSGVDAEKFRSNASFLDYQTAALTLSAEIVRTWFQLSEALAQVKVSLQQVETNTKVLELLKARFGTGQVRRMDILRQEQLLEATRERKIQAETRQQVLEHQLNVLLGRPPREDVEPVNSDLPELPPLPDTGLPAELIERRPDVKRAFELVKATDRDMASAISNQFPRISLSASISSSSANADDLFDNWVRSFAGNLLAPLFYGGELRAETDRTKAVKKQQVYMYGQTVLNAFREVEDALVREQKQQAVVRSIEKQLNLAKKSNEQIRVAYFNGIGNYLDVLTALDEEQQLQRDLLTEKLVLTEYRIALYRSLAGGFDTPLEEE